MKCVIISKEKVIDLGKWCLSNLRDFVNDEYFLTFNEVKRLRTLFFLACQKVFGEQLKSKKNYSVLEKLYYVLEKLYLVNEVWNEKLQKKFLEASNIVKKLKEENELRIEEIFNNSGKYKKSKVEDENELKIEEIFNTSVNDKYSKMEFSLEETNRIFILIKDGLYNCFEIKEDLYYEIKDFNYIYEVYNFRYNSLDRD